MATLHAFYSSDHCSFFELQTGNPSESKRFEDLPATITSEIFSPYHHTLQSRGDFIKTEKFSDLVRQHRLTDLLNAIEAGYGYSGEGAIALISFTQYLGGHHA